MERCKNGDVEIQREVEFECPLVPPDVLLPKATETNLENAPAEAKDSFNISQVATGIVALLAVGFVANFAIGALAKDR